MSSFNSSVKQAQHLAWGRGTEAWANQMPRVFPERSESPAVLWFLFTRPNYSSGVCCNLNRIELPLGLHKYGGPYWKRAWLKTQAICYHNRDVTKNYRNTIFSKPLRAKSYADVHLASNSRSLRPSCDIYYSLSDLCGVDKLFFVWN